MAAIEYFESFAALKRRLDELAPRTDIIDLPMTFTTNLVIDDRAPKQYSAEEERQRDECERFFIKRLHDLALQVMTGSAYEPKVYKS